MSDISTTLDHILAEYRKEKTHNSDHPVALLDSEIARVLATVELCDLTAFMDALEKFHEAIDIAGEGLTTTDGINAVFRLREYVHEELARSLGTCGCRGSTVQTPESWKKVADRAEEIMFYRNVGGMIHPILEKKPK